MATVAALYRLPIYCTQHLIIPLYMLIVKQFRKWRLATE